jgi:hypothetical protein
VVVLADDLAGLADPGAALARVARALRPEGVVLAGLTDGAPAPVAADDAEDRARLDADLVGVLQDLDEMRRLVAPDLPSTAPVVALWREGGDGFEGALVPAVMHAEIVRRLPEAVVRLVGPPGSSAATTRLDAPPLTAAGEASSLSAAAAEASAVIVLDGDAPDPDPADAGMIHEMAGPPGLLRLPGPETAHPLLLTERAFPASALAERRDFLRASGALPAAERRLVIVAHPALESVAGELAAAVAVLEEAVGDLAIVVLEGVEPDPDGSAAAAAAALWRALGFRPALLPEDAPLEDTLAVLAGASAVVGAPGPALVAALAYRRPTVILAGPDDEEAASALAARCGGLLRAVSAVDLAGALEPALADGAPQDGFGVDRVVASLDARLEALADGARRHALRAFARHRPALVLGARELGEHLALVREAYEAQGERIRAERRRVGDLLRAREAELGELEERRDRAEELLRAERRRADRLTEMLREGNAAANRLQLEVTGARLAHADAAPAARARRLGMRFLGKVARRLRALRPRA